MLGYCGAGSFRDAKESGSPDRPMDARYSTFEAKMTNECSNLFIHSDGSLADSHTRRARTGPLILFHRWGRDVSLEAFIGHAVDASRNRSAALASSAPVLDSDASTRRGLLRMH
jgi:hypothetical protein